MIITHNYAELDAPLQPSAADTFAIYILDHEGSDPSLPRLLIAASDLKAD